MTTGLGPGGRGDRLARLIQARLDAGDSLRDIARRAQAAGHDVSHSFIDNVRQNTVQRAPDWEKVQALAAGLGVPEDRIRRLVVQDFYGWDPGEHPEDPEDLADLFDAMRVKFAPLQQSTPERRELRNVLYRALVEFNST